jgi:hypothetical protein
MNPLTSKKAGIFLASSVFAMIFCSIFIEKSSVAEGTEICSTCLGGARGQAQAATQPMNPATAGGWGANVAALVGRVPQAGSLESLVSFPGQLPTAPTQAPLYTGVGPIPGSFQGNGIPLTPGLDLGNWQSLQPTSGGPFVFDFQPFSQAGPSAQQMEQWKLAQLRQLATQQRLGELPPSAPSVAIPSNF